MKLREQENVFLFEFGLIVPAVLKYFSVNVYFYITCADVVYPSGEKSSLFTHFLLQSKIFLMYIM